MKTRLLLALLILSLVNACNKEEVDLSLDKEILGNWLSVSVYFKQDNLIVEDEKGINVNLGCYYLTSVQFKKDKTYVVNGRGDTIAGTWQIDSKRKKLILTCASNPDNKPFEFDVAITNNELTWENEWIQIKHKEI